MSRLAIYGKNVLIEGDLLEATVITHQGKIVEIVRDKKVESDSYQFIDAGENVVMPGLIDCHVHINEPGRTEWEGFETATRAAAAGGITTLVDMPLNSSPVTTTVDGFEQKLSHASQKLNVNCGFWGGIVPGNAHYVKPLIEAGVLGFKAFLTHSGIDEFPNVTESDLRKVMPIIAESGLPLLVHCELDEPHEGQSLLDQNPTNYVAYLASRPKEWEDKAIALMIRLAEEFDCRTHIVHVSSANSIKQIETARNAGYPITAETCPHYLCFAAEEIPDGQTVYKCAPPIREKANQEQLWEAITDSVLDFVGTDHSPAPAQLKHLDSGNLKEAYFVTGEFKPGALEQFLKDYIS